MRDDALYIVSPGNGLSTRVLYSDLKMDYAPGIKFMAYEDFAIMIVKTAKKYRVAARIFLSSKAGDYRCDIEDLSEFTDEEHRGLEDLNDCILSCMSALERAKKAKDDCLFYAEGTKICMTETEDEIEDVIRKADARQRELRLLYGL